jgi:hypothetical protein
MAISLIKTPNQMLLEQAGVPHLATGGQPPSKAKMQAELATSTQAAQQKPNVNPTKAQLIAFIKQNPQMFNYGNPLANLKLVRGEFITDQLKNYGNPAQKEYVAWQSDNLQRRLMGTDESDKVIPVYRPDPTNRFGGKTGLETQPTYLDPTMIQKQIAAMKAGQPYGVPQLTPQQLKTFYTLEGRSDMGFNDIDFNDLKALDIAEKLKAEGHHPDQAYYAAALYNKNKQATRLNAPLPQAWNGFGTSEYGKTGMDYNNAYNAFGKLVDHPQNKEFNTLIDTAYHQPQQPQATQPQDAAQMPNVDIMGNAAGFKKGGVVKSKPFRDISKVLIQKHISGK